MGKMVDLIGAAQGGSIEHRSRIVVCYPPAAAQDVNGHNARTRAWIASRLAELQGVEFAGDFDEDYRYPEPLYFVPKDTVCPVELARALGIRGCHDLFGGVAPYPFVATKAITHTLDSPAAYAPAGWSDHFGERVCDVVLPGATAFSRVSSAHVAPSRCPSGPRISTPLDR